VCGEGLGVVKRVGLWVSRGGCALGGYLYIYVWCVVFVVDSG